MRKGNRFTRKTINAPYQIDTGRFQSERKTCGDAQRVEEAEKLEAGGGNERVLGVLHVLEQMSVGCDRLGEIEVVVLVHPGDAEGAFELGDPVAERELEMRDDLALTHDLARQQPPVAPMFRVLRLGDQELVLETVEVVERLTQGSVFLARPNQPIAVHAARVDRGFTDETVGKSLDTPVVPRFQVLEVDDTDDEIGVCDHADALSESDDVGRVEEAFVGCGFTPARECVLDGAAGLDHEIAARVVLLAYDELTFAIPCLRQIEQQVVITYRHGDRDFHAVGRRAFGFERDGLVASGPWFWDQREVWLGRVFAHTSSCLEGAFLE